MAIIICINVAFSGALGPCATSSCTEPLNHLIISRSTHLSSSILYIYRYFGLDGDSTNRCLLCGLVLLRSLDSDGWRQEIPYARLPFAMGFVIVKKVLSPSMFPLWHPLLVACLPRTCCTDKRRSICLPQTLLLPLPILSLCPLPGHHRPWCRLWICRKIGPSISSFHPQTLSALHTTKMQASILISPVPVLIARPHAWTGRKLNCGDVDSSARQFSTSLPRGSHHHHLRRQEGTCSPSGPA